MKRVTIDGNSACAHIAYMLNDMAVIYPITPSSTMSELCDTFNTQDKTNIFGNPLKIVQMQSESGVAGAIHGSLSAGSLTTTFTSSQGLLLMLPNMYKIAGENLPTVIYLASRSIATHALNIFCDHSDVYSALKTGFNIISCSNVQEVNDISIVSHLASLKSSTPFLCFFDGFRTSHELNTIEQTTIDELKSIIDYNDIKRFKSRAVNNVQPFARGTNQNPDVFFQNRMATAYAYRDVLSAIKDSFKKVETITNRHYDTIEYFGDSNAKDVIISMGSSVDILKLAQKECKKTGVINVRVMKPFDEETFLKILPKSVKNITVLERNLDVNGVDSLSSIVMSCLYKNKINCNIFSGTYGLGGKEFTPNMAIACFENMKTRKKDNFTVGIYDNLSQTSIEVKDVYQDKNDHSIRIYGFGSDGSVSSAKNIIKILSERPNIYAQGYFDYDSKKSGSLTISHIRTSSTVINKPYNAEKVNIVLCNNPSFITKYDMTSCIKKGGTFLINTNQSSEELLNIMPNRMKEDIKTKNINVWIIDANAIAKKHNLNGKINTIMQTSLFKVMNEIPFKSSLNKIKKYIVESYSKKGDEIVNANLLAVDNCVNALTKLNTNKIEISDKLCSRVKGDEYYEEIIRPINNQEGGDIPVNKFNSDGSMPTNTSKLEKRGIANQIPEWIPENCIQCGRCTMMCPHASLRPIEFKQEKELPASFKTAKCFTSDNRYRVQVSPLDCTGCGVCAEVCPVKNKALKMNQSLEYREQQISNYEFLKELSPILPNNFDNTKNIQFKKPYFEFSGACAGCGETPYLKLVSQLFGDRMIVANATGCSSIYGGTYPTCPYAKDEYGFGPSWANSLFEDNAEFGMGIAKAKEIEREHFIKTIAKHKNSYSKTIKEIVELFLSDTNNHAQNKEIVNRLNFYKCTHRIDENDKEIFENISLFIKPSIWIVGGDGWAYDIGFGGLDHVVASNENVNILILDTEIYSNTGGQTSKSTPRGASSKFNTTGKTTPKKDILSMFMTYENVYLAQVSMGANPDQCLKAFKEAEEFNGPSIILAYAPCVNHGYDMSKSQTHCMNAVKSGYTTLFRYNSSLEDKMQIDSFEPTIEYNEFAESENRFKILNKYNPENKEKLLSKSEEDAKRRQSSYKNKD